MRRDAGRIGRRRVRLAHIPRRIGGVGGPWWVGLAAAGAIHLTTAALRLNGLVPRPQLLDYASYYAAAWALRLGASPYGWAPDLLAFLAEGQGLRTTPPALNSPPLWPWLLRPLTYLAFPASSIVWLLVLLVAAIIGHVLLVRLAGYPGWRMAAATLPLTLSFGPLFLNLSLGQSGVFLLLAALLVGGALARRSLRSDLLAAAFWTVAVATKLFPLLWIGALPLVRRRRLLIVCLVLCLASFAAVALLESGANATYWSRFLPGQAAGFASEVGIDDQSLGGYLGRIGRTQSYAVPGLDVEARHQVVWELPWELPPALTGGLTAVILALLLYGLWRCWARGGGSPEGLWYAWVLFSLLPFPHMERYNHVLALPAMAWLWRRGAPYRHVSIAAYGLFALSRLNHLWALALPAPWGPLATGFGLLGVVTLLVGVGHALARPGDRLAGLRRRPAEELGR